MKTIGMVRQERMWEINAMPDAAFVSFPKAPGIMIVFSPKGMESEQMAQTAKVSGIGNTNIAPMKSSGKTISRRAVTR